MNLLFRAFGTRWFPPSDHFEMHGDGPESELTLKALLYVTFSCSFVTSGSGVILIVSIPDNCVLPSYTSTDSQEIPYTVQSSQIK